jgi:hypothetical protein
MVSASSASTKPDVSELTGVSPIADNIMLTASSSVKGVIISPNEKKEGTEVPP